ncbi:probable E3 ubiquitin-protein ligase TRIML1 [Gracilinanus agilis]|uniref:probable E3 ubiquitin-protein ligase TRIML1 n=1 Tax=Gracilinanus agilis TaxID=191870 RepID=UPI001CFF2F34|nr:probable E3 ubiquitin-protein ligase TRIML1 [Gracilinanus agilis]
MDAKSLIENLKTELTCPICLSYFTEPVTVKCGHSFCIECLLHCKEGADETLTCAECRGTIEYSQLVPNEILQKLSITGKNVRPHLLQSMVGLTICDQHGEKEKIFCEEDQRLLCDSCLLSTEHKDHQVLPLEMAAERCKEKLQKTRNILQRREEEFKMALDSVRNTKAQYKKDIHALKQSVIYEYKKMHQFLLEEENLQLQRLDQESRDNLDKLEENKAKLSQQIQKLQQMILEIEENLDKEALEMLQDAKDTLKRNEELTFQEPEVTSPNWTTCSITGLRKMLMNFHRDITLDPETMNPHFILSEDMKGVLYERVTQNLSNNEENLDYAINILGTQTFNSGKHYWEVEVGYQTEWEVGICEINREATHSKIFEKIKTLFGFRFGSNFFLWNSQDGYHASQSINRVGIFLDFEKGYIAFYDAIRNSLIYSPPNIAFQKPLCPYFSLCLSNGISNYGHLIVCPKD